MINAVQVGTELQVHDIIPGSEAAIDAGCTCNVVAITTNHAQFTFRSNVEGARCYCFIDPSCQVHGQFVISDPSQIPKPSYA